MIKKLIGVMSIGFFTLTLLGSSVKQISLSAATTTWDWNGVIGTGQSLSVGTSPILSTSQPYNNLQLSLEGVTVPPYDANNSALKMVPLVEKYNALGYPAPYPKNLYGETPHSAMANQITYLTRTNLGSDYITAHSIVGESGQGMSVICKGATDTGSTGRAYAGSIFEVTAINRLAKAAGKTYGVGAIILTHGETDCGNTNYENEIYQMWSDYNQDIKAITGQTQPIPMLVVQQHSCPNNGTSIGTLVQWRSGLDYPGKIVCIGPNYHHTYNSDGVHLTSSGYQHLGEKYGQVYYERVICGNDWQPLQPVSAAQSGNVITVNFHVPVAPLVWDNVMEAPNQNNQTEWKNGKGFEVSTASGSRVTIQSVEISGSSVQITCADPLPASGVKVGYAFTGGGTKRTNGSFRWGLLRDSDPFTSRTGAALPNYCVAFEVAVPYNTTTPSPTPSLSPSPSIPASPTPSPELTPTPSATTMPGGCTITYSHNDWGSGATVNITIKNTGVSAINGWNLAWNFPGNQKITNMWNAAFTQSDTAVTATNLSYNGLIPAGGSVSFGFNLSYSGSNASPIRFTLNGTACQIQ